MDVIERGAVVRIREHLDMLLDYKICVQGVIKSHGIKLTRSLSQWCGTLMAVECVKDGVLGCIRDDPMDCSMYMYSCDMVIPVWMDCKYTELNVGDTVIVINYSNPYLNTGYTTAKYMEYIMFEDYDTDMLDTLSKYVYSSAVIDKLFPNGKIKLCGNFGIDKYEWIPGMVQKITSGSSLN